MNKAIHGLVSQLCSEFFPNLGLCLCRVRAKSRSIFFWRLTLRVQLHLIQALSKCAETQRYLNQAERAFRLTPEFLVAGRSSGLDDFAGCFAAHAIAFLRLLRVFSSCSQASLSGMMVAVRMIQTPFAGESTNTCRPANSLPSDIWPLAPMDLTVGFSVSTSVITTSFNFHVFMLHDSPFFFFFQEYGSFAWPFTYLLILMNTFQSSLFVTLFFLKTDF